jgi:hypothetical protein
MGVAAETLPKHPHEPRYLVERVAAKIRADAHERIILGKKNQITLCEAIERFIQSKSGTPKQPDQPLTSERSERVMCEAHSTEID